MLRGAAGPPGHARTRSRRWAGATRAEGVETTRANRSRRHGRHAGDGTDVRPGNARMPARGLPAAGPPDAPRPRGRLLVGLLLAAGVGGAALGLHTRPFLLHHLRISGLRQMTPAEVEVDLHLPPGTYTWQLRPWVMVWRLRQDPLVASARAWLIWPDTLAIDVRERIPVALIAGPGGPWEVDAHGLLLRQLPSGGALPPWTAPPPLRLPGLPPGLPWIVGVSLQDPVAGRPAKAPGLRQALGVVLGLGAEGRRAVADIFWSPRGTVGVRTRQGLDADYGDGGQARRKTEVLLGILRMAREEHVRLASVDVSAPDTPAARLLPGSPPLQYPALLPVTPAQAAR